MNNDTTLMGKSRKTVMKIERDSERQMMVRIVKRVAQKRETATADVCRDIGIRGKGTE